MVTTFKHAIQVKQYIAVTRWVTYKRKVGSICKPPLSDVADTFIIGKSNHEDKIKKQVAGFGLFFTWKRDFKLKPPNELFFPTRFVEERSLL